MKNQVQINDLLNDLMFVLEVSDKTSNSLNKKNPYAMKKFIDNVVDNHSSVYENLDENVQNEVQELVTKIKELIDERNSQKQVLTKDELKQVYVWLKERILHPTGIFDKGGRFYLEDDELVDVRSPSAKYPYSQMSAGRTSKFVKAMAEKYKPTSLKEFLDYFVVDNKKEIDGYFND